MDEKLIDNPELEQTVLAKIRVTMGFSQATLAWFKEIQNIKETSVELASLPVDEKRLKEIVKKPKEIRYERGHLIFKGVMCEQEEKALERLSEDGSYRQAIQKLYRESQIWFTEKEGDLIFSRFKSDWEKFLKDFAEKETKEYFVKLGIPDEKLPSIKVTIYQYKGCLELMLLIAIIGVTIQFFAEYPNIKKGIKELAEDFYKHIINPIKTKLGKRVSEACYRLLKDETSKLELSSPPPEEELISIDVRPIVRGADISEQTQLMFVGLLGANNELKKILKSFHERYDKPSHGFLFYEYLVHQPLHKLKTEVKLKHERPSVELIDHPKIRYDDVRNSLFFKGFMSEKEKGELKKLSNNEDYQKAVEELYQQSQRINEKTWIIYPFSPRLARKSLVMVKPEDAKRDETIDFFDDKDIAQADIIVKMQNSFFTQHIYDYWNKDETEKKEEKTKDVGYGRKLEFNDLKPFIDPQEFPESFFAKTKNFAVSFMEDIRGKIKNMDEISQKSYRILHGMIYPHFSSLKDKNKEIVILLIPIASSQVFYGNLFVCIPHFIRPDDDNRLKQLASELLKCVKKHYVPALALIHEHFFENLVSKQKNIGISELMDQYDVWLHNDKIGGSYNSPICRRAIAADPSEREKCCYKCEYFGWEKSSDNVVEKYLHKLWQDRKTIREPKYIYESLFFKNRLYTAPKMLGLLEDFLKPSKAKLKKDEDLLPSILVVASPGAGKEDVPKLIKLFSDFYNRGKTYKLNMASLKPDSVAPVAMVGGEFTNETTYKVESTYKLKGMFKEIREKTRDEFEKFVKDKCLNEKIGYDIKNISEREKKMDEIIKEKLWSIRVKKSIRRNKEKWERQLKKLRIKSFPELKNLGLENKFKEEAIEGNIIELKNDREKIKAEIKAEIGKIRELKGEKNELQKKRDKLYDIEKKLKKGTDVKNLEPEEKLIVKKLYGRFPIIVLDELNSMSIESQGVLLRFLENAEIAPIGGYEDEMLIDGKDDKDYREFITDFLIVGLMNEDPKAITREEAIRFLQRERYIGGLLGDLLYEHILKIRRLRPDLRARMMRNGEFKMPKLAEHRADIPVIFYGLMNKYKGDYFVNGKIRITMDAFEYLMRPELDWPENVRLLETLTKKVVEIIYEDYEKKEDKLIIVREKHIRKAMKEIGMIKEEKQKETPV